MTAVRAIWALSALRCVPSVAVRVAVRGYQRMWRCAASGDDDSVYGFVHTMQVPNDGGHGPLRSLRYETRNSGLLYLAATFEGLRTVEILARRMAKEAVWDQSAWNQVRRAKATRQRRLLLRSPLEVVACGGCGTGRRRRSVWLPAAMWSAARACER